MLEELLDLERQGWESLCAGSGADFYGRLMTGDGVMVLSHGQVLDREGVVGSLGQAPAWQSYDIADERLVPLGEDHAVLLYTGRARRDADGPGFLARMASLYTRRDGVWRLALYQQTPVPAGG